MKITARMKITLAAAVLTTSLSQTSVLAHDGARMDRGLEGVWLVSFMPRNCGTGESIPSAAFEGLFTFAADGTLSAWVQNAMITTTRSPSHGLWKRARFSRDYAVKFVHLRYNLATGAYLGRQEAAGTVDLGRGGNTFAADTSNKVYDTSGAEVGAGGCAYSTGVRLEWPD